MRLSRLGMKWMDKKTQNTFYELPASHAMSIVGVHLVENKPVDVYKRQQDHQEMETVKTIP